MLMQLMDEHAVQGFFDLSIFPGSLVSSGAPSFALRYRIDCPRSLILIAIPSTCG